MKDRLKHARIKSGMTQEKVAKRLGIDKKVISQIENNKVVSENFSGNIIAALSHLYQVSYTYLSAGDEKAKDLISADDLLQYITINQFLSWNAKGLLFHIFWNEDLEPSFNTIRQFSGDNYEQTSAGLKELFHYDMIFKYQLQGDIEVYGVNYLNICESIIMHRFMSRIHED